MTVNTDTICAVATRPGGALGVVRVSGPDAIRLTDSIFRSASGRTLTDSRAGSVLFGHITDDQGQIVDEVLISLFRAPHSYTGQDSTEISCHGSAYILEQVCRLLIEAGCRQAGPGEFTERAFLAGKMDLSQAEAVADLIASGNRATHRIAMSQLKGHFSSELSVLREQLLQLTSLLELELDFADHEELEFADRTDLQALLQRARTMLRELIESFRTGNAIKQGIQVAIVGAPNAGKSTLLNALLGDERAIVSDIRGTTRDTIEDTLTIAGVLVRLTDTAGIQTTDDTIEQMGIERSRQAIRKAHIVIELLDITAPQPVLEDSELTDSQTRVRVYNKVDLQSGNESAEEIYISAKHKQIAPLVSRLEQEVIRLTEHADNAMISNIRHYEALCRAEQGLQRVEEGLQQQLSGELLALDLHDALDALGEITGQVSSQEVLNTIFERFCIGK